jgi:hypothetical protein
VQPGLSWREHKILSTVSSSGPLFRVGRRPDPWQLPDWALAGADGTFGGRFDDPEAEYRVLYASSQRLGCFLETLARFRLDVALIAELAAIGGEDDFVPAGVVPLEWLHNRLIGSAYIPGAYADVGASDWIGHLRTELAREVVALGVPDFDAAVLQRSAPRKLTQTISIGDSMEFATCPGTVTISKTRRSSSRFGSRWPRWIGSPLKILTFN